VDLPRVDGKTASYVVDRRQRVVFDGAHAAPVAAPSIAGTSVFPDDPVRTPQSQADVIAAAQMHHLRKPLPLVFAMAVEKNQQGIGVVLFELLGDEDGNGKVVRTEAPVVDAFFAESQHARCHRSRRFSPP
jgi:hypothetical protein